MEAAMFWSRTDLKSEIQDTGKSKGYASDTPTEKWRTLDMSVGFAVVVFYFLLGLLPPMFFEARWRARPWRRSACFPQPSHFSTA